VCRDAAFPRAVARIAAEAAKYQLVAIRRCAPPKRLVYRFPESRSAGKELMRVQAELGITRAAAECLMRQVPTVQFAGLRKSYCKRDDLARLVEARTFSKGQVPS
jgi:hypothetical protein